MSIADRLSFEDYVSNGGDPPYAGAFRIRDARGQWTPIIVRRSGIKGMEWEAQYPNGGRVNAETVWVKAVRNPIDMETYRSMLPQQPQHDSTESPQMHTETLAIDQSETVGALTDALAKAQAEIKNAPKDSVNPAFVRDGRKGTYADLAAIVDACRPALGKFGIAVIQMPTNMQDGSVAVTTRLAHKGEWLQSTIAAKPTKFDAQGVGSVITYLRRYSLASMAGVAPEDDDGNGASGRGDPGSATNEVGGPPATTPRASPKVEAKLKETPKTIDPAAWWRGASLEIPRKGTWQDWQGRITSAIANAPDIAALDRLTAHNGETLNAMQAENAKAYAVVSASIKAQQTKLASLIAAE